ncbi:MAG: YkvA family protein [Burkholderiaceae bacterium]
MKWLIALRQRARLLKAETLALALAASDPRTPWIVKLLVFAAVAYALSPIDLIPDFIPVLGLLDDLVILPLLIGLAIRLTPPAVLTDARARAQRTVARGKKWGLIAAAIFIVVWALILGLAVSWLVRAFPSAA